MGIPVRVFMLPLSCESMIATNRTLEELLQELQVDDAKDVEVEGPLIGPGSASYEVAAKNSWKAHRNPKYGANSEMIDMVISYEEFQTLQRAGARIKQ